MLAMFNAILASEEKETPQVAKKANVIWLESDRLILVPYTPELVTEQHVGWLNNKILMSFSEQRHKDHTMETQRGFLEAFPKDSFIWIIQHKGHKIDIGTISAMVDPYNGVADMGILIGEVTYQGAGFGKEAWRRVIDFLVEGNIRKIEAGCRADNEAMKCLARSCGMYEEGRRWSHFLDDRDYPIDMVSYGYHNGIWRASIPGGQYD